MAGKSILYGFLILFSYWDIRSRRMSTGWVFGGVFFSALYALFGGQKILWGMVPGAVLCLLAWAAKGSIGCGDGLVLMIIGNLTDVRMSLLILSVAVMMSFGYSIVLLVFRKKRRKDVFPFIPFYLSAMVLIDMSVGRW